MGPQFSRHAQLPSVTILYIFCFSDQIASVVVVVVVVVVKFRYLKSTVSQHIQLRNYDQ